MTETTEPAAPTIEERAKDLLRVADDLLSMTAAACRTMLEALEAARAEDEAATLAKWNEANLAFRRMLPTAAEVIRESGRAIAAVEDAATARTEGGG